MLYRRRCGASSIDQPDPGHSKAVGSLDNGRQCGLSKEARLYSAEYILPIPRWIFSLAECLSRERLDQARWAEAVLGVLGRR